jgi:small subunit ribosomal protein S3
VTSKKKLSHAAVGRIVIERPAKNAKITIYSARPGVVIGKKGEDIESLRGALTKLMGVPVHVNIEEIRSRKSMRKSLPIRCPTTRKTRHVCRAMKRAMTNAMRLGARA